MVILWILLLFAVGYQWATYALVERFRKHELEPPAPFRPDYPVTHLKTIHGRQPRSESNWRSYIDQDYRGKSEVVFTVGKIGDPAADLAREIASQDERVKVIEGDASGLGTNPKVSSMIQGYPHCTMPFLLSTDSDMHAPPHYMDKLMAGFADPEVGMVTCLYCIQRVNSPALAMEALSVLDFSTSVLVARAIEGMSFGLGANMAFRREVLEQIGAFDVLGDYLAEDYQLGNRVTKAGWKVKLAGLVVEDVLPGMRLKEYLLHQLRWMRTYRISRPAGHFAFIVTQGTLWTTLLLLCQGWCLSSILALILWWRVRISCTAHNWAVFGATQVKRWIPWLILKDYFYLGLWALSLVGDRVRWGPRELQLFPDGRMRLVRRLDG
ncbi:glycosyltransferase [bacterium]|nr:glycosyltransferase [bacterium]